MGRPSWPWKIEYLDDDKVRYFRKMMPVLGAYKKTYTRPFNLYFKKHAGGEWQLVHQNEVNDCRCGKSYWDNPMKTIFCVPDIDFVPVTDYDSFITLLQVPKLCFECFNQTN